MLRITYSNTFDTYSVRGVEFGSYVYQVYCASSRRIRYEDHPQNEADNQTGNDYGCRLPFRADLRDHGAY
jgi:hypothetical protein